MGHITFIIGNGFDINIGLNTRYTDFYEVYKDIPSENKVIVDFKKRVLSDKKKKWRTWADFEKGMGIESNKFKGDNMIEDFIACYDDFVKNFSSYLHTECLRIDWDAVAEDIYTTFRNSVLQFYTHAKSLSTKELSTMVLSPNNSASVSFLQLNYTNAFDLLIEKSRLRDVVKQNQSNRQGITSIRSNHHIHGDKSVDIPW